MKLRNKKTGEIWEIEDSIAMKATHETATKAGCPSGVLTLHADSIKELNEEWEDYDEPKEYWYIEPDGSIIQNHKPTYINHLLDGLKSIGNYFETEEEAEKVVEKIKAWKRLKDKGFRFDGYGKDRIEFKLDEEYSEYTYNGYDEGCEFYENRKVRNDLDLLFGGK